MHLFIYYIESSYLSSLTVTEMATFLASYICCLNACKSSSPGASIPFKNCRYHLTKAFFIPVLCGPNEGFISNRAAGFKHPPRSLLWKEDSKETRSYEKKNVPPYVIIQCSELNGSVWANTATEGLRRRAADAF